MPEELTALHETKTISILVIFDLSSINKLYNSHLKNKNVLVK
jgi:hypothetical protein